MVHGDIFPSKENHRQPRRDTRIRRLQAYLLTLSLRRARLVFFAADRREELPR